MLTAAARKQEPCALLVLSLTNAESLQIHYGQEAADRFTVIAASIIRNAAHSSDILARIGPAQFALLIDSPVSLATANGAATKVLANALRNPGDLPEGQSLQFHMAVGYPQTAISATAHDAEPMVERLLAATKAMNNESSKRIRLVSI